MKKFTRIFGIVLLCLVLVSSLSFVFSADEVSGTDAPVSVTETVTEDCAETAEDVYESRYHSTAIALLPPLVAIVLALITKEVYSSLFIGIVTGGVLYGISSAGFNGEKVFNAILNDGLISNLSDSYNVGILIFLVVLGIIVVMMNRAGGSRAYGEWAARRIKSRRGAQVSTFGLGALIFVDDYFNCLTVGSVMRPLTDKQNISRAKLAYLIDATAAPICIIAPISSWAAAVSGTVQDANGADINGIALFIRTIPYNLYALLTIAMVLFIAISGKDFSSMRKHELNALKGDLFSGVEADAADSESVAPNSKGRVIDLILPVVALIFFCVAGMLYSGGFFSGTSLIDAFANCDASYGLALGSLAALIVNVIYFLLRRVLAFKDCMSSIPEGFKQMVPAILILTFAWGLKSMTGLLGASTFVAGVVEQFTAIRILLPAILFLVAVLLSFATGTSWGTFGILIPIVTGVFETELAAVSDAGSIPSLVIICISACLAGAVCGDHCSPISDTTIMSSTGAHCDHMTHVSTQLPYVMIVATISFVGYILAGFVQNVFLVLGLSLVLMIASLFLITFLANRKKD